MQLPLQDFAALVRIQAAAVAASSRTLLDVSVGSVLRAILEANSSIALWVQWLIMEVLSTTRAATSVGVDLDSWVADFGMARLQAVAAHGEVTFSRTTPGFEAMVPVGTVVRTGATADAQSFFVTADPTRLGWTGSGYMFAAGANEVTVPVDAAAAGWAGNVQAGVLRLLSSAVPGVDAVVNAYAAVGGLDAESDAALRLRFAGFIDSRNRATEQSVSFAIQGVRQGLQFQILERVDTEGAVRDGHFTVVLDDGSGLPSEALIEAVIGAIDPIRPIGATFSVRRPVLTQANIALRLIGSGAIVSSVQAALGGYVAGLPIGASLTISKIVQLAHEADERIQEVIDVRINGAAASLTPPVYGRLVPGTVQVLS